MNMVRLMYLLTGFPDLLQLVQSPRHLGQPRSTLQHAVGSELGRLGADGFSGEDVASTV